MNQETAIALFKEQTVRRTWHNDAWWFAVTDVITALTDSKNSIDYIKKMRSRDKELTEAWGQIVTPLLIDTRGGRQTINCANTEGLFRIIQSIPSPKAEPVKRWLAKVGSERIQKIEDPALTQEKLKQLYEQKGYPKDWIDDRLRDHMTDLELIFAMLGEKATTETSKLEKPDELIQSKKIARREKSDK